MKPSFCLSELVIQVGGELRGEDCVVSGFGPLETADSTQLSFVAQAKYRPLITSSQAKALVLKPEWSDSVDRPAIFTANPYAWFAKAQALFHPRPELTVGVHPQAHVHSDASIDPGAEIGALASIAEGAHIASRVVVYPGAVIGRNAVIGADTIIYPNVVIYDDCVIGERCIVHAGAVIGADGFGFAMDSGRWVKIPQVGRVVIGNDVEIGANTTIDRGAIGDTIIGDGVKLDNLIMLAHNVEIGSHTAIAACTGIAGSTTVGESCTIGGAAMIVGHIEIGDRVHIGGGTLVSKSLPSEKAYAGYPFAEAREWQKNAQHLRHLDEMAKTLKTLEKRLDELERKPN